MKYLLGISSKKSEENQRFVDDITAILTNKTNLINKGQSFSAILSYVAVDNYDVIFIDWEILDGSFDEFIKRLLKINKKIPIVIFTNDDQISGELCAPCELLFRIQTIHFLAM